MDEFGTAVNVPVPIVKPAIEPVVVFGPEVAFAT